MTNRLRNLMTKKATTNPYYLSLINPSPPQGEKSLLTKDSTPKDKKNNPQKHPPLSLGRDGWGRGRGRGSKAVGSDFLMVCM